MESCERGTVELTAWDFPAVPYLLLRPGTFYGGARLVQPTVFDVSPVSAVPPQLPMGEGKMEQRETERGRPLDAVLQGAKLRQLVHVDELLKVGSRHHL